MSNFPLDKFAALKTPFYAYDMQLLERTIDTVVKHATAYKFHVHYALKANSNLPVLQLISKKGLGADCVSGNEVIRASQNGFKHSDIVLAGVGKTDEEILIGLKHDIACFNVESGEELKIINQLAKENNLTARVALRLNPNVDANTHKYITTGLSENKFGIGLHELDEIVELVKTLPNISLSGMHFHIGSQITDLNSFKSLCNKANELNRWFIQKNITLKHLNVGGGLGIDYMTPDEHAIPDFDNYFGLYNKFLELNPGQQVHFELGRSIVAQCGNLISRVIFIKRGIKTNFMIVDAGMTELMRPALYGAYHKIQNLTKGNTIMNKEFYDVVGPVCESTDCFGKRLSLPASERGDLIAIRSAGAYGEVMANRYNLRELNESVYF
ncbi:MAG TPA: diaminopimelate decarboxylase [Flavobacteriales bacterium]|nr:diaminopimelate decarboxylase [Flavobacteriales bacterium]